MRSQCQIQKQKKGIVYYNKIIPSYAKNNTMNKKKEFRTERE